MKELIEFLWWEEDDLRTNIIVMKKIAKKVVGYHVVGNVDDRCQWGYAFVRLYGEEGYIGTVPYFLGFAEKDKYTDYKIFSTDYLSGKKKYVLRKIADFIDYEPEKPWLSNNGGDYYSGYSLYELPDGKFQVVYNSCLYSDFSDQGKSEGEIFNTKKEAVRFISEKANILYVNIID